MRSLLNVIFLRIFRTTIYVTVSLTFCAWIVQSSRYLGMFNTNNISISKFLKFTSYLSIDIIAVILPIALAVSSAFVYQRFTESNQLIALQSAGISPKKMLFSLLTLSFFVACFLYVTNAYISPLAWREFRLQEFKIKNNIDPPENAGEIFSNNGFSIYAQSYLGNFFFNNIFIIDARNSQKTYSYFAKSGTIINNVLVLSDGERIEADFQDQKKSITKFRSYHYDLKEILKTEKKAAQPNEKLMSELLVEDKCTSEMVFAQKALFHQKATSPLLTLIFSMLSFFLVLLRPYKRRQSFFGTTFLIATIITLQGVYFWIANAAIKNFEFIYLNYMLVSFSIIALTILIIRKRKL